MLLLSATGSLSTCPLIAFGSRCVFLYGFVPLLLQGVSGFFFFFGLMLLIYMLCWE